MTEVCPVHLRFLPCRRCPSGEIRATSDPFIVEIARRYQNGTVDFTLAVDADPYQRDLVELQ